MRAKIIAIDPGWSGAMAVFENGYLLNTGWTTNSEVEIPNSKTIPVSDAIGVLFME